MLMMMTIDFEYLWLWRLLVEKTRNRNEIFLVLELAALLLVVSSTKFQKRQPVAGSETSFVNELAFPFLCLVLGT